MEYVLKNSVLEVTLTDNGGTLNSIKDDNQNEYLWKGDATYWSGQAPILFPICGSIRNDKATTLDGKQLSMPRHGIVRKERFELEYVKEEQICFSITSNEKMLVQFPYPFKLYAKYELQGKRIVVSYTVENTGNETMPFFIGGHPGFACPMEEGESYSDYQVVFEKKENCSVPEPVTETGLIDMAKRSALLDHEDCITLQHSLFHKDAIILDELQSRKVTLTHKSKEKGVEISFEDFPYLILWSSANDGPFLALEPWVGLSTCSDEDDIFEHKRNVQMVKPKETKTYQHTIRIL